MPHPLPSVPALPGLDVYEIRRAARSANIHALIARARASLLQAAASTEDPALLAQLWASVQSLPDVAPAQLTGQAGGER